jgi:hypothetical protein
VQGGIGMVTRKRSQLTLYDKLSRLTFDQACRLIGEDGKRLITAGGKFDIDLQRQVRLGNHRFELRFFDRDRTVVTIWLEDGAQQRLQWKCSNGNMPCEEVGAAFSVILEHKTALGLAEPPEEELPLECLTEEQLIRRALRERKERARKERMTVRSADPSRPWTEYTVTSEESGKTYHLTLRGEARGESACTCPDFRCNTLGTCKHIMHALEKVKRRFPASQRRKPYKIEQLLLHLQYGDQATLRLERPVRLPEEAAKIVAPLENRAITNLPDLMRRIRKLQKLDQTVTITPDAEECIQQALFQQRISDRVAEIRRDPARHPLRTTLLKTELLPYQLDGIAFAVGAGRAILADDMGLGKTVQGLGVSELLAQEADIRRVLIICPTSLKSQWRNEIHRFSDRECQLVTGSAPDRAAQYDNDCFFTICNYEQVLRDVTSIERVNGI